MQRKEKVIVFGLGKRYQEYKGAIYRNFDVVACSSNSEADAVFCDVDYISPDKIMDFAYDFVLICCDADNSVYYQLVNELNITSDKIKLYRTIFSSGGLFHSENYEDLLALFVLKVIGKNPGNVYYLDLGANHPIFANNTYCLYQMGAEGVLVEANPELSEFIRFVRPRDTLISKAITLDGAGAEFYLTRKHGHSTLQYDKIIDAVKHESNLWDIMNTYHIEGISIDAIIATLKKSVDLMSIDIEGMDMDVLKQIDFNEFRPSIVIAETESYAFNDHKPNEFHEFFERKGYILFHHTEFNGIYVDNKFEDILKPYLFYKWF